MDLVRSKIVTIGGGTGSFMLLSALKQQGAKPQAIVNMVDNGGSSGILRDEYGVLPPGDIRQCLVALSDSPQLLRDLFNYRFDRGDLKGHTFGNIFLAALEKLSGNFTSGIAEAEKLLQLKGRVLPVTLSSTNLVLASKGRILNGQGKIDTTNLTSLRPFNLLLKPKAKINPEASAAIRQADLIVIAPGSLYSSLISNFLLEGTTKALASTKAPLVYICNLVTKPGQSDGFGVHDFAAEIEHYMGGRKLNYVIYNNQKPSRALLAKYARAGEHWVEFNPTILKDAHYKALGANLLSTATVKRDSHDPLVRNLLRHNGSKIMQILKSLL